MLQVCPHKLSGYTCPRRCEMKTPCLVCPQFCHQRLENLLMTCNLQSFVKFGVDPNRGCTNQNCSDGHFRVTCLTIPKGINCRYGTECTFGHDFPDLRRRICSERYDRHDSSSGHERRGSWDSSPPRHEWPTPRYSGSKDDMRASYRR